LTEGNVREALLDIRTNLGAGRFVNEAAVSQGVVQRVLYSLGWPVYDTGVVSPEHSINSRRVDYALCHPPNRPLVLVEVKQVGQSEGADRQLFEYAFHEGVPMAILTDGQEWSFFLPTEQGRYEERRVYKLDILERDPEEIEATLKRYLDYERIRSGEAIETARKDYRNAARKREAQRTLPEAWTKLIESKDELLIDLVSEKVEDLCGVKPAPEAVAAFLRNRVQLKGEDLADTTLVPRRYRQRQPTQANARIQQTLDFVGFTLYGQTYRCKSAVDAYMKVLGKLADRDPKFLERFAAYPKGRGKRPYLARSPEELYPGSPDLINKARELKPGWWVDANLSNQQKATLIRMACDVAGVQYGTDLRINFR
jgi:predicted type IV restriction endonuclease